MKLGSAIGAATVIVTLSMNAHAATWSALTNQFHDVAPTPLGPGQPTLLLDGSVLVPGGNDGTHGFWYVLRPDPSGSYVNGQWTRVANSNLWRAAFASQILSDGRLWVFGGEFATPNISQNANPNQGEIYDPIANTWTAISADPYGSGGGFPHNVGVGDDPSVMLPNGTILVQVNYSSSSPPPNSASVEDLFSATSGWSPGYHWYQFSDYAVPNLLEAGLTLLPDGTAFTVAAEDGGKAAYRYDYTIASGNPWIPAAPAPWPLGNGSEIGAQCLLYSGQVLVFGANASPSANLGLYTPPGAANRNGAGSWASSMPATPAGADFGDTAACVMPNGRVLSLSSTVTPYEYDPSANTFTQTATLPSGAVQTQGPNMLQLPSGEVLLLAGSNFSFGYAGYATIYTPDGGPQDAWRPRIASVSGPDGSGRYTLTGAQLAGLTMGASYGDDAQMDTNYPILRITPLGQVSPVYNLPVVQLGDRTPAPGRQTSVQFIVPSGVPQGAYSLQVVTNGVASTPLGKGLSFRCGASGCVAGQYEVVGASTSAGTATCNGTADNTGTGLAYSSSTFGFSSWKDVLALLYGGLDNTTGTVDCGSTKRRQLVAQWANLFQTGCSNAVSTCTTASLPTGTTTTTINGQLWHAFRPDDSSSVASIFASLIGIGTVPGTGGNTISVPPSASALNGFGTSPYCNALNWDTTPANEPPGGHHCVLGAHEQYVGPGGVLDTTANDGVHRRPPPGTWGDVPDPNQATYGAAVLPTSYQDNDPIRRTCIGRRTFVGNPNVPAEEVCNIDGTLGVVLPVPSVDFIPAQNGGRSAYPTSACVGWISSESLPVHLCAPRGTFQQACPTSDVLFGGGCFSPVDASGSSLCENDPSQWPNQGTYPAGDARIFNLFVFDGFAGYTLTSAGGQTLAFAGGFGRIHSQLPLWDRSAPSTKGTPCQDLTSSQQIGCLVQADPCSIGLADSNANNASDVDVRVNQITP